MLEAPQINSGNSLGEKLSGIGDRQRVDIILTNPPFGGEEELGVLNNFPADKQTAETALLFMQLIMRKLRCAPKPGRAAVAAPNGILFDDGICARVKEDLLTNFKSNHVLPYISKNILAGPTWQPEHCVGICLSNLWLFWQLFRMPALGCQILQI